jgi:hypothetical protein
MKPWVRWAILGATLVVIVILFVVLSPGETSDGVSPTPPSSPSRSAADGSPTDSPTPEPPPGPTVIEVTVQGDQVQGPKRPTATQGDEVLIVVRADVSDHVHVHGYDLMDDVAPDAPARIRFRANVAGVFEVELEDAGRALFQLEITP